MSKCPETTQAPVNSPSVRPQVKYCPLFVAAFGGLYGGEFADAAEGNRGRECLGGRCAWWSITGACALPVLAHRMGQAADNLTSAAESLDSLVGLVEPAVRQDPGYLFVRVVGQ